MAMSTESTETMLLVSIVTASLTVMLGTFVTATAQAQDENMTMEEATNASLAQYPDSMENETTMEEETAALVGNMTGNMTSQNMTNGNMTA